MKTYSAYFEDRTEVYTWRNIFCSDSVDEVHHMFSFIYQAYYKAPLYMFITTIDIGIYLSTFIHIYVCMYVCLSVHLSVYLSVYPSVCLSIHLSVCLSVCLSITMALVFLLISIQCNLFMFKICNSIFHSA